MYRKESCDLLRQPAQQKCVFANSTTAQVFPIKSRKKRATIACVGSPQRIFSVQQKINAVVATCHRKRYLQRHAIKIPPNKLQFQSLNIFAQSYQAVFVKIVTTPVQVNFPHISRRKAPFAVPARPCSNFLFCAKAFCKKMWLIPHQANGVSEPFLLRPVDVRNAYQN